MAYSALPAGHGVAGTKFDDAILAYEMVADNKEESTLAAVEKNLVVTLKYIWCYERYAFVAAITWIFMLPIFLRMFTYFKLIIFSIQNLPTC